MTIPPLINNTNQKELKTAFKKQYSVLQQAIMSIKNEDGLDLKVENYHSSFKTRLAQQYKSAQNCGSIVSNNGCILTNEDNTLTYYKNLTGHTLSSVFIDDGGFITPDGTLLLFEQGAQAANSGYIVSIDVNGYKKRPNRMGHDLFMFQITEDSRVLPMGAEGTHFGTENDRKNYCNKNSGHSFNGFTCAYYALTDNNYFKNLK